MHLCEYFTFSFDVTLMTTFKRKFSIIIRNTDINTQCIAMFKSITLKLL